MKLNKLTILGLVLLLIVSVMSCSDPDDEDPKTTEDTFNRSEMLSFWADHTIIPSLDAYDKSLSTLVAAKDNFSSNHNIENLNTLRAAWLDAYKAWQYISMFDIGKAEEIGYRNFVNIYPTDIDEINTFISSGNYNLTLPSTFDAQGFPAIEYLLYGVEDSDDKIMLTLADENHLEYLSSLVDRLKSLSTQVNEHWKTEYRNTFVANDGSSATASTDKIVNDFLYYYEKFFRAGKIGIPAGVFSGSPISQAVEAPYSGYSKVLFLEAFKAVQNFFRGDGFDGSTGKSLKQYLENRQEATQLESISTEILSQWEKVEPAIMNLDDSFKDQVEADNLKMLTAYDEIQKVVILLKVDMMQALNIQVDYVDADGD